MVEQKLVGVPTLRKQLLRETRFCVRSAGKTAARNQMARASCLSLRRGKRYCETQRIHVCWKTARRGHVKVGVNKKVHVMARLLSFVRFRTEEDGSCKKMHDARLFQDGSLQFRQKSTKRCQKVSSSLNIFVGRPLFKKIDHLRTGVRISSYLTPL